MMSSGATRPCPRPLRYGLILVVACTAVTCDDQRSVTGSPGEDLWYPLVETSESPINPPGIPPEFETPPTIFEYGVAPSFADEIATAWAWMRYWGSHADQSLNIKVRPVGGELQWEEDYHDAHAELFPSTRALYTWGDINTGIGCGLRMDAHSLHKAWHQLIVIGQWGLETGTATGQAEQESCSGGGGGGGGGGGTGEGECYLCVQWLYFENGVLVDYEWECSPIEYSYCEA